MGSADQDFRSRLPVTAPLLLHHHLRAPHPVPAPSPPDPTPLQPSSTPLRQPVPRITQAGNASPLCYFQRIPPIQRQPSIGSSQPLVPTSQSPQPTIRLPSTFPMLHLYFSIKAQLMSGTLSLRPYRKSSTPHSVSNASTIQRNSQRTFTQ